MPSASPSPPPFFQDPPRLGNTWDSDPLLRSLLGRLLPADVSRQAVLHLRHLGERAAGDLLSMAELAEAQPPCHVPFDAWGRRVDRLEVSPGWTALKRAAAEEGLVAIAYEGCHAEERALLRLLTPLVKLETGRQAVAVASEALEAFGGAGYVEDTGLPRLLRDAQVLTIWEGTTNVLALDALRAIDREEALPALLADAGRLLAPLPAGASAAVRAALEGAAASARASDDAERREAGARAAARGLARAYAGALLLDQAHWSQAAGDAAAPLWAAAAARWSAGLATAGGAPAADVETSRLLALEEPAAAAAVLPGG